LADLDQSGTTFHPLERLLVMLRPVHLLLVIVAVGSATLSILDRPERSAEPPAIAGPPIRVAIAPAPRPPAPPPPAQRQVSFDARLAASGEAPAAFHRDVETIVDGWTAVELGAVRCFRDGCSVEIVADDARTLDALAATPALHAYEGWSARSDGEAGPGGRVRATWYFLAPTPT
jgi:hypothetical protein